MILLALCLAVEEGDEPLGLGGHAQLTELGPLSLVTSLGTFVQAGSHHLTMRIRLSEKEYRYAIDTKTTIVIRTK
jgi:hypothetical protein